jgi:hypothetical protein
MADSEGSAFISAVGHALDMADHREDDHDSYFIHNFIAQLGEQGYQIVPIPTVQTITVHDPLGEVSTSVTFNGRGIFKMAAARLSLFKRSDIDQGALT